MKIFAVAVLVVVAGVSQAMGACTDTLPTDLATYGCQQYTCEGLAASNNCGNNWGTCSKLATGLISESCQCSCAPVVVAPVPAPVPAPAPPCVAYSEEACKQVANSLGLSQGGAGYAMVGDYDTIGCYAYDSGDYANMVFYGKCTKGLIGSALNWIGGDSDAFASCKKQMQAIPTAKDQYRPNGYDCSVGCHPYSLDACKAAAAALGLSEGGAGSAFVGNYGDKGCYAYSSGGYAGMAFYSTGGNNAEMSKLPGKRDNWYRPAGHDCN